MNLQTLNLMQVQQPDTYIFDLKQEESLHV